MIKKEGEKKFVLRSKKTGKVLGRFATREEAEKREKEIQFFKHRKK